MDTMVIELDDKREEELCVASVDIKRGGDVVAQVKFKIVLLRDGTVFAGYMTKRGECSDHYSTLVRQVNT